MVLRRSLWMMLLFSLVLVPPCPAKEGKAGNTRDSAAIRGVVEGLYKSFNAQDLKGVMTAFSSDPHIVLMGTGPGEVYVGDEAVGGAFNQFFNRFEANALSFRYDWVVSASRGGSGWFAVTTTVEAVVKGEKKERSFNMSGNLRKEKGKWRIVLMHISRLRAEEQPTAGQP